MPAGGKVTGVILADHLKNLDWRARTARPYDRVDEETVDEVIGLVLPLLDPHNVFGTDDPGEG